MRPFMAVLFVIAQPADAKGRWGGFCGVSPAVYAALQPVPHL